MPRVDHKGQRRVRLRAYLYDGGLCNGGLFVQQESLKYGFGSTQPATATAALSEDAR